MSEMPVNLSRRKRAEWVLYRHALYLDDEARGICQCGEWSVLASRGTWPEHVVDLLEEAGALSSPTPPRPARGEQKHEPTATDDGEGRR